MDVVIIAETRDGAMAGGLGLMRSLMMGYSVVS